MTTVDTIEGILRIMRERPDVRDALRREILTDELLTLPQRFADLVSVVRDIGKTVEQHTSILEQHSREISRPGC